MAKVRIIIIYRNNCRRFLPVGQDFLYLGVGFGEPILAQLDELLRFLELLGHLIDVEFSVFQSLDNVLQLSDGILVFGLCCHGW